MICPACSNETANPKFCSRSCAAIYNNKKKPKRPLKDSCSKCNGAIGRTSWKDYRTICNDCRPRVDWSTVTLGEVRARAKYQKSARIRDLARQTYFGANPNPECSVCGYSTHVEVCHIKPIKDHSDDISVSVVNALENLVGLCPNHHWELDNQLLTLSR